MKSFEEQLNELINQSDRVAADLSREVFLIGRADAAISYLRIVRERTAGQVSELLERRLLSALAAPSGVHLNGQGEAFGSYDPNWPQ